MLVIFAFAVLLALAVGYLVYQYSEISLTGDVVKNLNNGVQEQQLLINKTKTAVEKIAEHRNVSSEQVAALLEMLSSTEKKNKELAQQLAEASRHHGGGATSPNPGY